MKKNFSIVVPVLNEEENLKILLPYLKDISDDVLVIDGGSTDKSYDVCKKFHNIRFFNQKKKKAGGGMGKGNAMLEAAKHSKFNVICFIDADLAHEPKYINNLVNPIINGDFKHVSASRMLGGSSELFKGGDHFFRLLGSLVINYLISFKFNFTMSDCQNGFRAIDKKLLTRLNCSSAHTTIEQEMVGKTLALGIPILEIPSHEYSRINGVSKINILKHGPIYIFYLIKILFFSKKPINMTKFNKLKKKYQYDWWR